MVVMLSTQEAYVKRIPREGGIDLEFGFAAKQQFTMTFRGERMVRASMTLVQGREPTTQAMTVLDSQTNVDTISLFSGLESNGVLLVDVVADDGFSLDKDDVVVHCDDVAILDSDFAAILRMLLELEGKPEENLGAHITQLRKKLCKNIKGLLAA